VDKEGSAAISTDSTLPIDDRIIHASLILISEHGLGGVTMSQVATAAGVARQTLYNHYGDIDSIVAATIERHDRQSIELLEASLQIAESPIDRLGQMVRHFASIGAHEHHSHDLRGGLAAELRASLGGYQNVVEDHIWRIVDDGQQTGDFRKDLVLEIDTVLVRALLDGVRCLAADSPDQVATVAATGLRTIVAALR
jgi:AcrR family transcriptional regulator